MAKFICSTTDNANRFGESLAKAEIPFHRIDDTLILRDNIAEHFKDVIGSVYLDMFTKWSACSFSTKRMEHDYRKRLRGLSIRFVEEIRESTTNFIMGTQDAKRAR